VVAGREALVGEIHDDALAVQRTEVLGDQAADDVLLRGPELGRSAGEAVGVLLRKTDVEGRALHA